MCTDHTDLLPRRRNSMRKDSACVQISLIPSPEEQVVLLKFRCGYKRMNKRMATKMQTKPLDPPPPPPCRENNKQTSGAPPPPAPPPPADQASGDPHTDNCTVVSRTCRRLPIHVWIGMSLCPAKTSRNTQCLYRQQSEEMAAK